MLTALGQITKERFGIHVVGSFVDIHELRQRSGLRDRFRSGNEGVRDGYHNIARLHAGSNESEPERIGSIRSPYAVIGFAEFGKCLLKSLDKWSSNETRRSDDGLKDFRQFGLEFCMWSNEVKERNRIRAQLKFS
jgi:hypothetical protein